jgi:hypothetical protein
VATPPTMTIIPSPRSTTSTTATSSPAPPELSKAACTGISVGAGLTFLLVIIGVILCVRRKRNNVSTASNQKELLNRRRRSPMFELGGGLDGIAELETREQFLGLPGGRNNNSRYTGALREERLDRE